MLATVFAGQIQEAASKVAPEECFNRRAFLVLRRAAAPRAISNRQTPEKLETGVTSTKQRFKYFLIANFCTFFRTRIDRQFICGPRVSLPLLLANSAWMAPCPR